MVTLGLASMLAFLVAGASEPMAADDQDSVIGEIAAQSAGYIENQSRSNAPNEPLRADVPHRMTRIFLSTALAEADIRFAMEVASRRPDTILVFRGLPDGHSIRSFHAALAKHHGPGLLPPIHLDPPAFTAAGVDEVPVVAVYGGGKLLGSVAGMIDPDWLQEQIRLGEVGRLPRRGPVASIAEPDLMVRMQSRFRAIDWQQWRDAQRDSLFRAMRPQPLPRAGTSRIRFRDPTFVVKATIRHGDQVLARSGEPINPLERIPFLQTVVAFDATDPAQLAIVRRWVAEAPSRVTVMTTGLPDAGSNRFVEQTSMALGAPVMLFRPEVGVALGIERVPSRVVADGKRFRIEEVAVGESQ